MTQEQQTQRKNLFIGGFACLGGLILAFIIFAALDMPGSTITKVISVPLLLGAVGCFAGAFKIKRESGAGDNDHTGHR